MIARDITRDCELLAVLASALVSWACTAIVHADVHTPPERDAPDHRAWCTAEDAAEARVRERVQTQLSDASAWDALTFAIAVEPTPDGYQLTLDTDHAGTRGTRIFQAVTCDEAIEAASLLLLLTLSNESPEPEREPEPEPEPEPEVLGAPAATSRPEALLRAAALGELGFLPRAALGAELALGVAFRRSRLELAGLWLPGVASARSDDGARVEIALMAARLGYCHRLTGDPLALFGCLGLELGRATGRGLELEQGRERDHLWQAGYVSLRAAAHLTRQLALLIEPGLAIPFTRRRFVSSDAEGAPRAGLHTPAPVSGRLTIALEALF